VDTGGRLYPKPSAGTHATFSQQAYHAAQ